uniref:hypothetical protein n=1 Tax=Amycolatopsis sp. CA-096443 TaxID=3239919 RepID=UPI003F4942EF
MGTDAAPGRGGAALGRLLELMERSRRWRARHPDLVPAVTPGAVPTAEDRRREREALARYDAMALRNAVELGVPMPPEHPGPQWQQVVTGEDREALLDWLPLVCSYWAADGELAEMGDVVSDATEAQARDLLAREGFEHVHDAELAEEHRVRLFLHRRDGLLAEIYASRWSGGWEAETVTVRGCVEVLDDDLLACGPHRWLEIGPDPRQTRYAAINAYLHLGRPQRSLRVQLAVLRAAARPALPWPHPGIDSWLGPSSLSESADFSPEATRASEAASKTASRLALAGMPQHVHDLLGPTLIRP